MLQQLTGVQKTNSCYSGKGRHVNSLHFHYMIHSHFSNTVKPVWNGTRT